MATQRNILIDSNVYIGNDGKTYNLFGKVKSVTPPVIKNVNIEAKDLGSLGVYKINTGKIEAMETKVVLNSFYPDVFKSISNPFDSVYLKIYSNLMSYTNDKKDSDKLVKMFLRGTSAEFPLLGELKAHENIEYEMNFSISAARLVCGGEELYDVDIPNNIFKYSGNDLYDSIKQLLGI